MGEAMTLIEPREVEAEPTVRWWRFTVEGVAVPQGSKKGFVDKFGHVRVVDDNKTELNRWRKHVAKTARAGLPSWLAEPHDGPVILNLLVVRRRSDNDYLVDGVTLSKGARRFADTAPDNDKVERAIFDALTEVAFVNDARIFDNRTRAIIGGPGVGPYVDVEIGFVT